MLGIKFVFFLSFLISISIFCTVILFYQYDVKDGNLISRSKDMITPQEFYSKNFNTEEKKIFIIGSSQVVAINPTYVKNYLSSHHYDDYEIYNLAVISDVPINRLNSIDKIISTQPVLILYGVSDRDFTFMPKSIQDNLLPDPHVFFVTLLNEIKQISSIDLELFEFPQRTTLSIMIDLMNFLKGHSSDSVFYENTPFMKITEDAFIVKHDMNYRKSGFTSIPNPEDNVNFIALEEISQKFTSNNIKIVFFVTPANKFYSEFMPSEYKLSFDLILDNLRKNSSSEVYDLFYKYGDLNIWNDLTHVAINSTIYSDDIAKIILVNIEK